MGTDTIGGIDISKYLTEDAKKEIAERVYTERVTEYVEDVLKSRSIGNSSGIVDMILAQVATNYIQKMEKDFEDRFSNACKSEIDDPKSNFRDNIGYNLLDAGARWIEKNTETVEDIMVDNIKAAAKELSTEQFISRISVQINVNNLLRGALLSTYVSEANHIAAVANSPFRVARESDKNDAAKKIIEVLAKVLLPEHVNAEDRALFVKKMMEVDIVNTLAAGQVK